MRERAENVFPERTQEPAATPTPSGVIGVCHTCRSPNPCPLPGNPMSRGGNSIGPAGLPQGDYPTKMCFWRPPEWLHEDTQEGPEKPDIVPTPVEYVDVCIFAVLVFAAPKTAQEAPNIAPRQTQRPSREPQDCQRRPQDGPRDPQGSH